MKFIIKVIRLWWLFDVFSVAIIDHMNMCSVSQILCVLQIVNFLHIYLGFKTLEIHHSWISSLTTAPESVAKELPTELMN